MNRRRLIFGLCATTAFVMAVFAALCVARTRCGVALPAYVDMALNEPEIKSIPLETDELAALRWLDYVTGLLPKTEEVEWWGSASERQFGLFARRYNIAQRTCRR